MFDRVRLDKTAVRFTTLDRGTILTGVARMYVIQCYSEDSSRQVIH